MYEFETIAACHKMLRDMFKVKTGETVAITYDTVSCEKVAEATAQAAVALGAKPLLLKMSAPIHKSKMADYERPYNALYGALANADIWIEYNCNKTCLCYSQLFEDVVRDNTNIRYLCNCNCNEGTMVRMIGRQDIPTLVDFYHKIEKAHLKSKRVHIKSDLGTDFYCDFVPGREMAIADGAYDKPRVAMLLGQILWVPEFESVNGTMVVDGFMHPLYPTLSNNITLTLEKGLITKFEGGKEAQDLERWMKSFDDPNVLRTSHASYGMNTGAILCGNEIEDERIWGTILWGFGSISQYMVPEIPGGYPAKAHSDALLYNCDVWLDDEQFLKKGQVVGPTEEIVELARRIGK